MDKEQEENKKRERKMRGRKNEDWEANAIKLKE